MGTRTRQNEICTLRGRGASICISTQRGASQTISSLFIRNRRVTLGCFSPPLSHHYQQMQTVLAMVTILPVLQKPNALFTLCIHQKIHDKVFQECWGFFFWRGKKTRNLPIIIKRSPLVPISLNTSYNSLTICNNQVVIFSLFPSITINTDFYSSGKKILILRDWGQNFSSVTFYRHVKKQHFTTTAVNLL